MRKLVCIALLICGCSQHVRTDEHRTVLQLDQVPENVLKVAHKKFPDVRFDSAWKLDTGAFQIRGKNKVGKIHELELTSAGDILEAE